LLLPLPRLLRGARARPTEGVSAAPGETRALTEVALYVLPPAVALITAAVVWELWVRAADVPTYIVPAPSVVLDRFFAGIGFFAKHGAITLAEALAGFALGAGVAIAGASLMAHSRVLERSLFPLAVLVKVTPIVAVAPLFVIWFGFGSFPKVLIAALITFFPVLVNGLTGLRSVKPEAHEFFRSVNASNMQTYWKLRLPGSLPYLFAAFRICVPLAVIGAVVGEWFSGDRGLGSVIIVAHNNLDMPTLFAAILTLAILGVGLTVLTWQLERRVLFWHESNITN